MEQMEEREEDIKSPVNDKKFVVKRFKKCYKEFIRDFCKSFPEFSDKAKDCYINIDEWNDFISSFIDTLEPHILNISQKNESIFLENKLSIITNVDSSLIWKDSSSTNKEIIWKYMQTLYILGITYKGDYGDLTKII